ncbi:MAG: hypothetical protein MUO76_15760 [Anaerolineaceae bacterium]|nr:hypothetical protein [Anaerolineaceae bacterium]
MENDWKTKTLLIGGITGLVTGLFAAYILIQQSEKQEKIPKLNPGEGVKLGLGVLTLLRLISEIASRD